MAERLRRRSWSYLLERRKQRTAYIALHRKRLAGGSLKGPDASQMESLERDLSVDDIVFFRALASAEYKAVQEKTKAAQAQKGFFSRVFGGRSDAQAEGQLGDREREELYAAINYQPDAGGVADDPKV